MKSILLKLSLVVSLMFVLSLSTVNAQRKMDKLDRGVVAVKNNSGGYFVSWRLLATDSDETLFNLYHRPMGGSFTKLNNQPLAVTNFSPAGSVGTGSQFYVTTVINGIESEPSGTFRVPTTGYPTIYRSAFLDISFSPALDGLELHRYHHKYIWPADLDGDGEYDFVVDRLSVDGGTHKVQGYLRTGVLLWTIDMGPNVPISQGHNDMVIAYDMNGDGKAEVIIKSSDGTKFSDGKGVFGSATLDTDNDGIIDYSTQNVKNQPHYITIIDGMTGVEKNSIAMQLPSNYTRTNKSIFMGTEYSSLNGHMAITYLDGKKPSVTFKYMTRTSADQRHWYYASAYGYNNEGTLVNWYNWERGNTHAAEAHGVRVADVDFDGRDELLDIGYGLKYDGTLAFNAFLSHGDRFRVGDIDPDRPGLETFAVQQNASDMLGKLIYDAATGEHIKKFYLTSIGDVGRGECMDVDSTRKGYEFWSTMANIYDAKGNILKEGGSPWPYEGIWWDGELDREQLSATDGSGFNAMVEKYSHSTKAFGNRLIEFSKMTDWRLKAKNGVRPGFFGDVIGDWREEVILERKGSVVIDGVTYETSLGFVGFSTDYPTKHRLYCLMQNPAYRMQTTTKGYYQSPMTDYYLGYHMPPPPVAPVQEAKMTWASGNSFDTSSSNFVVMHTSNRTSFANGDDVMFDISGDNSSVINMPVDLAPSYLWAMNPKGKDFIISGDGKFTGEMGLTKSMYGKFTLNGDHTYTGKTIISEGILCVNGSLNSVVDLRAKGTLMGNAILNGGIILNEALNSDGGKLSPGNGLDAGKLGKIVINSHVVMKGKTNIEIDVLPHDGNKNDSIVINGNFNVSGINTIQINGNIEPGTYSMIKWSGEFSGSVENFNISGITGLPVRMLIEDNTLKLVVEATRSAATVSWTGETDNKWDYLSSNFLTQTVPHQSTFFVQNDSVLFDDTAIRTQISLSEQMITNGVYFSNSEKNYQLTGTGGISGNQSFTKEGKGLLDLGNIQSSYTGKTVYNNAVVKVESLNQSSVAGVLGQAGNQPTNWVMTNTRLIIDGVNSNTDRGLTLVGNDTLEVSKSNGIASMTGVFAGSGNLVKTGAGQLNLSGNSANTYTGQTIIKAGTIGLGGILMNNSGFGTSGIIQMENGARINMFNSTSYGQSPTWHITIPEGNNATLNTSSRCDIKGTISGGGTLNFNIPYVRTDLVATGTNFTGTLNVTGANPFRVTTNSIGFPQARVHLGANVSMGAYSSVGASSTNASTVVRIGSLSGETTSSVGGGTYFIGTDNRNATYNGVINAGATITKSGTGKWTLTNASTLTSNFTVSGGTLEVRNSAGSATGTGNLTVSNAMLSGTGRIGGAIIMSTNSSLMPGISENSTGTLTADKNVSLTMYATTIMKVNNTTNDLLKVGGTLYLNGTLDLRNLAGDWVAGKSYTIFEATAISGNYTTITPETPGTGLTWNTSRISEGIISVDVANGIEDIYGKSVRVYPQPVRDYCTIEYGTFAKANRIELIDQTGKIILSENISNAESHVLYIGALDPGFYVVRIINTNNQAVVRKLVKM